MDNESSSLSAVEAPPQAGANGADGANPGNARPRRRRPSRWVVFPALAIVVLALGGLGFNMYWNGAHYVSTDNARVDGDPVSVGSMDAGRVFSTNVAVGDSVRQGQVLARIELPSFVRTLQNGQPDLQFLGASDERVDVSSPMNGVVIDLPAAVGATVAQGQAVVMLVDPSRLWVTANVDENQFSRLKVGQTAEVHLDAMNATVAGRVSQLTPATAEVFSLLPQSNTTTNFTKVAQVFPVRIALDAPNKTGLLGSSATVQIRVA